MEILTSVRRLYISFKSLVNDFVYSFGRAALLLLIEVQNHTVPVRERRRIRVIMAENRDRWRTLVNAVMNLKGSITFGEILDQLRTSHLLRKDSGPCVTSCPNTFVGNVTCTVSLKDPTNSTSYGS